MRVSRNRLPQNRPQHVLILIIGAPKKGPNLLKLPNMRSMAFTISIRIFVYKYIYIYICIYIYVDEM